MSAKRKVQTSVQTLENPRMIFSVYGSTGVGTAGTANGSLQVICKDQSIMLEKRGFQKSEE